MIIAGRSLHNDMLIRLLRAPMWYFDTTPLGRIVNRFSKDIDLIDNAIPNLMRFVLNSLSLSVVFVLLVSLFLPRRIGLGSFHLSIFHLFCISHTDYCSLPVDDRITDSLGGSGLFHQGIATNQSINRTINRTIKQSRDKIINEPINQLGVGTNG